MKVTKSGKVRFYSPNSRHLKSNKRGTTVQTYRKARFARSGDMKMYGKLLNRSLLSEQQHETAQEKKQDALAVVATTVVKAVKAKQPAVKQTGTKKAAKSS